MGAHVGPRRRQLVGFISASRSLAPCALHRWLSRVLAEHQLERAPLIIINKAHGRRRRCSLAPLRGQTNTSCQLLTKTKPSPRKNTNEQPKLAHRMALVARRRDHVQAEGQDARAVPELHQSGRDGLGQLVASLRHQRLQAQVSELSHRRGKCASLYLWT